ncbi:MAG: hypothetical protein OXU81_09555 [Gammaproteobacteria bacterium]|nr:hypothetical protein [Gammaproteobacteria bacterium]
MRRPSPRHAWGGSIEVERVADTVKANARDLKLDEDTWGFETE